MAGSTLRWHRRSSTWGWHTGSRVTLARRPSSRSEHGETIEVLEGPRVDQKGVTRIRGKALGDGATGWMSVKGNQGIPFFRESESYAAHVAVLVKLLTNRGVRVRYRFNQRGT